MVVGAQEEIGYERHERHEIALTLPNFAEARWRASIEPLRPQPGTGRSLFVTFVSFVANPRSAIEPPRVD